jgi:hypothetical protein
VNTVHYPVDDDRKVECQLAVGAHATVETVQTMTRTSPFASLLRQPRE